MPGTRIGLLGVRSSVSTHTADDDPADGPQDTGRRDPRDFRDRDSSIAVNSYTTVRRRDTVQHERFAAYWRDVHGPLCARVPGLGWYVQHHFARQQDSHLWPAPDGVDPVPGYVLDGAVEIGFASTDDQAVFQEASPILFSDEQNVFEETVAYDLPHGSATYTDRLPDPVPNGPDRVDRVHVHLTPRPGAQDALRSFLADELAPAFAADPLVLRLRLHQPAPHDNSTPNPPAPRVRHEVPDERVALSVLEVAFATSLDRRRFFASDTYTDTLAGQVAHASHVTAFPVVGVHTFVRDGRLTTAGLRGSRVAELVTDLAALNQVGPEVRALFAPAG